MKIIIIEDEGITRQWLKKKLEELGQDCHVEGIFSNGSQALAYLAKAGEVDVVFTDIRMPVMDGLVFLEKLRQMGLAPYKVILSAYDEFQYARQAMKLGAQEFVLKPEITKDSLKRILQEAGEYLGQKRQEKEEQEVKEPAKKRGGTLLALAKQEGVDWEQLWAVFGGEFGDSGDRKENGKLPLVMADFFLERQAVGEDVEELLDLFLEQEKMCGVCFWSGNQNFSLGYVVQEGEARRFKMMVNLWDVLQIHLGMKVYIGISRVQEDGKVNEMYRQAVAARENRFFFGIPGCRLYDDMRIVENGEQGELYFDHSIREITDCLNQNAYAASVEKVKIFLENVGKADYLPPAYVKALCDEILSAYRHSIRKYALNEEEKPRVGGIELLMGREVMELGQLAHAMLEEVEYLSSLLQKKKGGQQYSASIKDVMKYVEMHFGERISLEQVADAVFLSRPYLSTLFKKETGKKFSNYLQEVRLEKSCSMLRDSRLSIGEIADRVGFFDAAHFSRAFKERYGCSPLEYRKAK